MTINKQEINKQDTLNVIADLSPGFYRLTQDVLFGQIWQENSLTPRERSLITVAALTALNRTEQLPVHLRTAQENGLSVQELSAVITHLAFYAGWPAAASAFVRLASVNNGENV